MKNRILGIDPGISGGLALISADALLVEKMPIVSINNKNRIDMAGLSALIISWMPEMAVIETQQSMPGQGVSSTFRIGLNYGLLLGALHGMLIPVTEVRPQAWKKYLGLSADKDASRHRATQLFPDHSVSFSKKTNDGMAEAALIAYYYHQNFLNKGN